MIGILRNLRATGTVTVVAGVLCLYLLVWGCSSHSPTSPSRTRSGDAVTISAYLGKSDAMDQALAALPSPSRLLRGYLLGAALISVTGGLVLVFALPDSRTSSIANTVSVR